MIIHYSRHQLEGRADERHYDYRHYPQISNGTSRGYPHPSNIGTCPKHAIHPAQEYPTTYRQWETLQLPDAPNDACDGQH